MTSIFVRKRAIGWIFDGGMFRVYLSQVLFYKMARTLPHTDSPDMRQITRRALPRLAAPRRTPQPRRGVESAQEGYRHVALLLHDIEECVLNRGDAGPLPLFVPDGGLRQQGIHLFAMHPRMVL
jgi:hypothetical protein